MLLGMWHDRERLSWETKRTKDEKAQSCMIPNSAKDNYLKGRSAMCIKARALGR
jgi:hypothetical protein